MARGKVANKLCFTEVSVQTYRAWKTIGIHLQCKYLSYIFI